MDEPEGAEAAEIRDKCTEALASIQRGSDSAPVKKQRPPPPPMPPKPAEPMPAPSGRWRSGQKQTDAQAPGQEAPSSSTPGAVADDPVPGQEASSSQVPGEAGPLAPEAEQKGKFYDLGELARLVEAGVKKALEEREAAKIKGDGIVFGIASQEGSRDNE